MKKLGLFCLFVVVLGGAALAQTSSTGGTAEQFRSGYQKWLEEDVTYLITPEESAKFATLKDDAKRDAFVRQFWSRRDPTPNTAENEFKEEYYRRIAYSNVHFAGKLAGWKTDRGRTYILQGRPDEITADKNSMGVPREIWRYNGSASNVIFEDQCRLGEFVQVNWRASHA